MFIETPEFVAMMEGQISPSARRRVQHNIDNQLEEQLKTGGPVNDIEVVVEGLTTRTNDHPYYRMTYEKIAASSLRALAGLYTRDSQGRRFLQQF